MIEMSPPKSWPRAADGTYEAIKLHSGGTTFPLRGADGSTIYRVVDEPDAADLESRGFRRDRISQHMKLVESDLLRKAYTGQIARETGHTAPISNTGRLPSDGELLRRGLSAQLRREPHSIGDPDPDRKRELGEVEIDLGTGPRKIRLAHDPENGALHLHGVAVLTSELDPQWMRSFESSAAAFNEAQGTAEQEDQRITLSALIERALRRHKWAADAVVRQLDHERYGAV